MIDIEAARPERLRRGCGAARLRLVQSLPDRPANCRTKSATSASRASAAAVDRRLAEAGAQRVVMRAEAIDLRLEPAEMGKVADRIARRPTLSS
jgi:hypothetical protein